MMIPGISCLTETSFAGTSGAVLGVAAGTLAVTVTGTSGTALTLTVASELALLDLVEEELDDEPDVVLPIPLSASKKPC